MGQRIPQMEDDLKILNVRQLQNFESGISQQPRIGFYSNFKMKLKIMKKSNQSGIFQKSNWIVPKFKYPAAGTAAPPHFVQG